MDPARSFVQANAPPAQSSSSLPPGVPLEQAVYELTGLRVTPDRNAPSGHISFGLLNASTQHISCPKKAGKTLADLSLAILHLCGIPQANQTFISMGKLYRIRNMSAEDIDKVLLRKFEKQKVRVLGSKTGTITDPTDHTLEDAYYARRMEQTQQAAQSLSQRLQATTTKRHRIRTGAETRRAPPSVNSPDARLFGYDIALPATDEEDVASSLLGVDLAPRFHCSHEEHYDAWDGLTCRECTERWLIDMYAFVRLWLSCRASFWGTVAATDPTVSGLAGPTVAGPSATDPVRRAVRKRDAATAAHSAVAREWCLRVPKWDAMRQALETLNEIVDFADYFDHDELIRARGREKGHIQMEAFSLLAAGLLIKSHVELEAEGKPTGLFTGREGAPQGQDGTASGYEELIRRVNSY